MSNQTVSKTIELTLPFIDADTKLIHSTSCMINGETLYSFEEMTVAEYVERFNTSVLASGWPNGMSVLDMGLSLRQIGEEYADAFFESLLEGDWEDE